MCWLSYIWCPIFIMKVYNEKAKLHTFKLLTDSLLITKTPKMDTIYGQYSAVHGQLPFSKLCFLTYNLKAAVFNKYLFSQISLFLSSIVSANKKVHFPPLKTRIEADPNSFADPNYEKGIRIRPTRENADPDPTYEKNPDPD